MSESELARTVEQFAKLTCTLSEAQLEKPWTWQSHTLTIRDAFFRTYEELREWAVRLRTERITRANPPSSAQLILAQYLAAYWDLHSALLGIEGEQFERPPAEGEWSLRKVLAHALSSETGFYVVVRYALDRQRSQDKGPVGISREQYTAMSGLDEAAFNAITAGPVEGLLDYHHSLQERILREFAGIQEAELEPSEYWAEELMSVRYYLHRFDSHLR
jgi:hypothetical protein